MKTLQEINNSWIQWNNTSRFVLLIITNKRGYNCGTIKKSAPILGYKLPSNKLTELVVRKAKPISKPKKLTDGRGLFLITY